jgi:phosphoglycolate phosphatase-like HAD superfamily hydrolase
MSARARVAGLLFDLDGTLVDSAPAICDAAAASLTALGHPVDPDAIRPHLGAPLAELYELFVGDANEERLQTFVAGYIEAHDQHALATPTILPGVVEGLEVLKAGLGVPFAVATTKPSDRARQQLKATGLLPHFRHVQGTDEGMEPKPAPDVVEHAARGLAIAPELTWMIGDTERDVRAAIAAGATAVVVAYDAQAQARAAGFGADHVITSLEELPTLLRG